MPGMAGMLGAGAGAIAVVGAAACTGAAAAGAAAGAALAGAGAGALAAGARAGGDPPRLRAIFTGRERSCGHFN